MRPSRLRKSWSSRIQDHKAQQDAYKRHHEREVEMHVCHRVWLLYAFIRRPCSAYNTMTTSKRNMIRIAETIATMAFVLIRYY